MFYCFYVLGCFRSLCISCCNVGVIKNCSSGGGGGSSSMSSSSNSTNSNKPNNSSSMAWQLIYLVDVMKVEQR